MKIQICTVLALFIWTGFTGTANGQESTIRIGLEVGAKQAAVSSNAGFSLHAKNENQKLISLAAEELLLFEMTEDSVILVSSGDRELGYYSQPLIVRGSRSGNIVFKGQGYAGQLELFVLDGKLTVINELKMEKYLRGVVPNEIGSVTEDLAEAAKAQAVAARTYAFKKKGRRAKLGFDLYGDVRDQVYKGVTSETELTGKAVKDTRGKVLVHDNKPIDAFYHSTCGGKTAGIDEVWSGEPVSYLQVGRDNFGTGDFCSSSPKYRWQDNWAGSALESVIKERIFDVTKQDTSGISVERLYNLAVLNRGPSGRASKIKIGFETKEFLLTGEQFRRVVRNEGHILKSSLFRLGLKRNEDLTIDSVVVSGAGFGHGLGMCQWGARNMAKDNFSFEQILKAYYRGATIKKMY